MCADVLEDAPVSVCACVRSDVHVDAPELILHACADVRMHRCDAIVAA